jgi:TonB family protein
VRDESLGIPFISSLAIHGLVILLGSFLVHQSNLHRREFLPINLVDLPRPEISPPLKKIEAPEAKNAPSPPPPKAEKPKPPPAIEKTPIVKPDSPAPLPPPLGKEEPTKVVEMKPAPSAKAETAPSFASGARVEGGGSEAGAGNLFGKGDIGVVPGTGTAGGGGGTAASGLGRGSGAPGLPAQSVLRTNREAKPIQTVRANYPPMALRAGLESDVTLKIEVDAQGNVTKAEITKSGGVGFDEEALKTVMQSRFEPAQRDGHNVPADFTYIYRFRLQR